MRLAREALPELRGEILGDGPERDTVLRQIRAASLTDAVDAPGFVAQARVERALQDGLCLVLPSRREGYGLVVVEAASHGTPSVVVAGPDNAAVELIDEGVNGLVAPSAAAEDLSAAILRVHQAGSGLRESTFGWFERNREELALESSLATVVAAYRTP